MADEPHRLTPLSDLSGYTVADGDPDPHGWAVARRAMAPWSGEYMT